MVRNPVILWLSRKLVMHAMIPNVNDDASQLASFAISTLCFLHSNRRCFGGSPITKSSRISPKLVRFRFIPLLTGQSAGTEVHLWSIVISWATSFSTAPRKTSYPNGRCSFFRTLKDRTPGYYNLGGSSVCEEDI